LPFDDISDFPSQVVGILDASVGTKTIEWRMSMDRVTKTEARIVSKKTMLAVKCLHISIRVVFSYYFIDEPL
jgi:hypothetical protein